MTSTNHAHPYRSSGFRPVHAPVAARSTGDRRRTRVARAITSALRPHTEAMEGRVLLSAYTLNPLGSFGLNGTGIHPESTLVEDASGNLYGTAAAGGPYGYGTVFEIARGSTAITTLAAFNGTNGSTPVGQLAIDGAGNLYGMTSPGDPSDNGTLFEVAGGSGAITTLAHFGNGTYPSGGVTIDASGNLFGTTQKGGSANGGTVFELAKGSASLTTVVSFTGTNGADPKAGITLDASGNLYGTTYSGGANGYGEVFKIAKGSTAITTLASFATSGGYNPEGGVTFDAAGNLFGTTLLGGSLNQGTIFEIASGTSTATTLASFLGSPYPGGPINSVVIDAAGNIFGTALSAGSPDGAVFELPKGATRITTYAQFNNGTNNRTGGAKTLAALMVDASGTIYGTENEAGANSNGIVFEIAPGSNAMTTVASFDPTNGVSPALVTVDQAGDVFGTTQSGGTGTGGTVFEVAAGSTAISSLAFFSTSTGYPPYGPLAVDAAGDVYGVTAAGGALNEGSIFEIPAGSTGATVVASFNRTNGASPENGLLIDAAGDLYGASTAGGANSDGTLFELPRGSTTITAVMSFASPTSTPLTVDPAGNIYGVSGNSVFELASGSGAVTNVASFNASSAGSLGHRLAVDTAGNLYGTTDGTGNGTIFEIAKGSSALTTLASFNGTNGTNPSGGVVIDASGNLFGTTYSGGAHGWGTAFELPRGSNAITTLMSFDGNSVFGPQYGVTLDSRGNLYGTSIAGGISDQGTVFELAANTAVTLTSAGNANPSPAGQPLTFTASVSGGVPDGETIMLLDASNDNAVVAKGTLTGGSAALTVPAGTLAGTHNLFAAYAGDANLAASESLPYAQTVLAPPPALAGAPIINGDNPNGLYNALGQTTPGTQRSMVEDVVYTFNEPVTITDANAAFTLAVAGPAGGTLPTTLYAQAVANSNGTRWAVSLTGMPEGTIGSIANGEYSITINPAYVFAAADGVTSMAPGTGRTDTFYRLYGDVFGTRNVNNADYNLFKKSINTYDPMFDDFGTGTTSSNADYNVFKKDLNIDYSSDGFVTTI